MDGILTLSYNACRNHFMYMGGGGTLLNFLITITITHYKDKNYGRGGGGIVVLKLSYEK